MESNMNKKPIDTRTDREKAIDHFRITNEMKYIPENNRKFEIGEKVQIGNLEDCIIEEKLFDEKCYLVKYSRTDREIKTENLLNVWNWMTIHKINRNENKEVFTQNENIQLNYQQRDLSDAILGTFYHFGIDMNPEYQRDYVWELDDKIKLIDSIFNNIDIGKFVMIHKEYKDNDIMYEVLDGKQRIRAILDFYEDRIIYRGFKFSELNIKDRMHFRGYTISYCSINDCSIQQKLKIFYHINQNGKIMDQDHLNKIKAMIKED
jgi:hypothetical protein